MDTIFESGISLAREEKWQHPLMYRYHEKHYYGAAHGMAGILYLLLTVSVIASRGLVSVFIL